MWVNNYTCRSLIGNQVQPFVFIIYKEIGMKKGVILIPGCLLLITKEKAEQVIIQQLFPK